MTGFGNAVNRLAELAHDFGLFGIAEVEAIRRGYGTRATTSDIARSFGDCVHCTDARPELAPAAVAVG